MNARAFLQGLFDTAVNAAHPARCLPAHLPAPPATGRLVILAAGKAAGAMAEVAERPYLDGRGLPTERLRGPPGPPPPPSRAPPPPPGGPARPPHPPRGRRSAARATR